MVKISSIIPTTARVTSTDMNDAHPVRPGVPTFGRPVGRSQSDSFRREALPLPMQDMRSDRELGHDKIINDLSNSFFMRKTKEVDDLTTIDDVAGPIGVQQYVDDMSEVIEPEYIRNGQYLDVEV